MNPVVPVQWHVADEWSPLEAVLIGTGAAMGNVPELSDTFDPQSRWHVVNGTYPAEADVSRELDTLSAMMVQRGIRVLRPDSVGMNQVFTRDIGLIIDSSFIMTHMVEGRAKEQEGLQSMLDRNSGHVLHPPNSVSMEGGDIMVMGDEIWVGYAESTDFEHHTTARTNRAALDWLQQQFPERKVRGFELQKSDLDPLKNALHLDCCLSPLGMHHAIFQPIGFKNPQDVEWLRERYSTDRLMVISPEEMQLMQANIFSIAPGVVISNPSFLRTNDQMKAWGYDVIEADLSETSKMGGLLRCVTMPLRRTP